MGWRFFSRLVFLALTASFCLSKADFGLTTDVRDVEAMNGLYVSLNFPPLRGWVAVGGDPCLEQWQGVSCVITNITSLKLNGLNLGGTLDITLGLFPSIIEIDLSDNHIGGSIPSKLPHTLLTLSLNNNNLSGGIPDAFQQMTSLTNLDLSANNLSGRLPPSFGNLSSLISLYLQNNKLTGVLDVLEDLPLVALNVENNLFSGPIPVKLLDIPNLRKEGNPFNTTVIPSPPLALPPLLSAEPPLSAMAPRLARAPRQQGHWPPPSETPKTESSRAFFTTKRAIMVAVSVVGIVIILGLCLLLAMCFKRRQEREDAERHYVGAYKSHIEKPGSKSSVQEHTQVKKVPKDSIAKFRSGNRNSEIYQKPQDAEGIDLTRMPKRSRNNMDHDIDMNFMPLQPPPPPPCFPVNKVVVNPVVHKEELMRISSTKSLKSSNSLMVFTIATLQQYTDSFSEESLLGKGTFGSAYKAELPDGKLLAVKKLNNMAARQQTDEEFLDLVFSISKIRHANIVEFVGYCNEHGQRLLVHKYCEMGTLHDALHVDDEIHNKLSWSARIRVALGAARALQYLHEVCQPPIMHQNFRSANILLDDKLAACVSDCGVAHLLSSGHGNELAGRLLTSNGYAAPEFELGSYTCKSDIHSFGVVMLELLTGRKSFDKSRSRWEQCLVRWAIPRLHDIDSLTAMVDPSLKGAYPAKALSRFADIIARCVQPEPEFRPAMSEIVQDLLHMI